MATHEIVMVDLERLVGHPRNANRMSREAMEKLKRHLARGGRYEPLVVRKHPARAGDYELINGHHRAQVLRELGHKQAACLVWDLDDRETLLLLATVNRLSGEDAPGKRLELLEALRRNHGWEVAELAQWLPEEKELLERVLGDPPAALEAGPEISEMPEALTVFMSGREKREVLRALKKVDEDLGKALVRLALGKGE